MMPVKGVDAKGYVRVRNGADVAGREHEFNHGGNAWHDTLAGR